MSYLQLEPRHKFDLTWILFLVLFVLAVWLGASCTPEKRLSRLLHNHPELTKRDSAVVIKNDSIKGVKDLFFFSDSTFLVDPSFHVTADVRIGEHGYIAPKWFGADTVMHFATEPVIKLPDLKPNKTTPVDTIVKHFEDSITVRAWRQGKGIEISITKPAYVIPHVEKVIENKVICDPCVTSWYDYFFRGWFVVTLLLFAFGIYRYASARV